jgi:four helix bundle protein
LALEPGNRGCHLSREHRHSTVIPGQITTGMSDAHVEVMTAKTVEDLKLWEKATAFWRCVNGLLERPAFRRDWKLRAQLSDATDSVLSNIAEGFAQSTDRGFVRYLYDSKASTAEARSRLWMAAQRKHMTEDEYRRADTIGDEVARMTVGLIKYLLSSDRRDRGLGRRSSQRQFTRPGPAE